MAKSRNASMLYRLSYRDSAHDSYLMGTMHAMDPVLLPSIERAEGYLEKVTHFFAETDLEAMQQLAPMPLEGYDLKDYWSWRLYERKRRFALKAFQVNLDHFRFLHPFWLQATLAYRLMSFGRGISMDQHLWTYAKTRGLPCAGIESWEYHKGVIDRMEVKEQLRQVLLLLQNPGKQRAKLYKLMHRYAEGDIQYLYKVTRSGLGSLRSLMINERNELMSRKIVEVVCAHSAFIAVGAAHLGGGLGILRKLKHAGVHIQALHL